MTVKIILLVFGIWVLFVTGFLFYLYSASNDLRNEESQKELIEMQNLYGNCRPTIPKEVAFESGIFQAETVEEKENTKNEFLSEIERCKKLKHLAVCVASGCKWNEEK